MRIAVASGKGGTGKTTIATNLAVLLAQRGETVAYVDCDVEEPNGHIFLRPTIQSTREVTIPVPEADESVCTGCGACGRACRFSAIIALKRGVLTFPQLCHGCGGCRLACPVGAITEVPRPVGVVEQGTAGKLAFIQGRLNISEPMAPPVVRGTLAATPPGHTLILDAPPGTSCPVIESIRTADVVLLVTEPTPFGLNDLKLAVKMTRELGLPFAVVVNRAGIGDDAVFAYCRSENIPVLAEIPDDRRVAEAYSRCQLAVEAVPRLRPYFEALVDALPELAARPAGTRPSYTASSSALNEVSAGAPPSQTTPSETLQEVQELVVISGKGGTGKTSIVASFCTLADNAVAVDCDVDAADLHLVLKPSIRHRWEFSGGSVASIDPQACSGCGACLAHCRFEAIHVVRDNGRPRFIVDPIACEGCGVCVDLCPERAATLTPVVNGEWFISDTRTGPLVHARLGVAQENSGKLVSLVRREARALAKATGRDLLICDGSPGVGCPVIASITGARLVLVVSEPTPSARHDLARVLELTRHFRIETALCLNKIDINPQLSAQMEQEADHLGLPLLGRVRYDPAVTRAQVEGRSVVENAASPAARDIRALWENVKKALRRSSTDAREKDTQMPRNEE